jgi:hypothetical protein
VGEPPEGFTLPRQSFVERPVDTGVSVREVITRLSATAWTTEVEIEDDMADYSELPNDGR